MYFLQLLKVILVIYPKKHVYILLTIDKYGVVVLKCV